MGRLQEKVIVVTGAARGIGAAIARRCVAEGGRVALWDVDVGALAALADELADGRPEAVLHATVNVASSAAAGLAAMEARERFGRIDGLVNNAGVVADAQLRKMSEDQWDRVIDINLKGVFNCTRALVDPLLARGGAIVNISSVVGVYGNFGQTNYAAAKAGVIGMTKTWARELGPKNVRANAICPGFIATPILESMPAPVLDRLLEAVPMRRIGRPDEIAAVTAFLLSDEASYVNGAVLEVSGGLVM